MNIADVSRIYTKPVINKEPAPVAQDSIDRVMVVLKSTERALISFIATNSGLANSTVSRVIVKLFKDGCVDVYVDKHERQSRKFVTLRH